MAQLLFGDRIAREGRLGVGCSAAVFDPSGQLLLLIRRADNGLWAVPGGYMEPGESFTEACAREVLEETGLTVRIGRLISIYTNPHALLVYPNGNRWQLVIMHFEAFPEAGDLTNNAEASEARYFTQAEAGKLELGRMDHLRIADAFAFGGTTFVHDTMF
jgi:ADP-ribose pyrophosphatase YjhB (NUDIX family)